MEAKSEKDHPLSLKVMRLTRPSLFTGIAMSSEAKMSNDQSANMKSDFAVPSPNTGIGQVMLLPQSFENIYLGETFSCCICVHNSSPDVVYDVSVKAVLQMNNQRLPLLDEESEDVSWLASDGIINKIVQHEVKEVGIHILVCAVHYKGKTGNEVSFRKFFKFQVMKPLDVKTKFYNAESEDVYLEAGVQNITSGTIFLEKVTLDSAPSYTVTPLNNLVGNQGWRDMSVFGPTGAVNPHDTRQHLFCLRPTRDSPEGTSTSKQTANIGKLDIVWRTSMGDKGRLQTSQLQRMIWASQYGDIKAMVEEIPNKARIEEPFALTISIMNISERELKLHVDFMEKSEGTKWQGVSSKPLDPLPAGKKVLLKLHVIPFLPGLQTIPGLIIKDTFLKRTYEYENLAQVYVTNEPTQREDLAAFLQLVT